MLLLDPFYYLKLMPYLFLIRQITFKNCVFFYNLELMLILRTQVVSLDVGSLDSIIPKWKAVSLFLLYKWENWDLEKII